MNGPRTPLADSYMRARYGLPADFDLESVPLAHLEDIGAQFHREAEAKAEAERKEAEAEQKRLAALEPPKIIPRFITTAAHLKGDRRVSGVASTGAINSKNVVHCPGGAIIILPVPLLVNHDLFKCVGSVEAAQLNDEGEIHIWANLDSRCDENTWRRIRSGELACFSVGVDTKTLPAPVNLHGIDHYFSYRLREISLCASGANHKCIVTLIYPPISEARSPEIVDSGAMKTFQAYEQRLAALESKPAAMSYRGTWNDGDDYAENEFVTLRGSLWACRATGTRSRPGTDGTWRLAVKHGAAGKGAR